MFKLITTTLCLALFLIIPQIAYSFGQWDTVPRIPCDVGSGGGLSLCDVYDNRIYAICGGITNNFYYYDIGSYTWHDLTNTVPEGLVFDEGSCLTFAAGETGKVFLFAYNENSEADEAYLFHKFFIYRGRTGQIGLFPDFWQQFPGPPFELGAGTALTNYIKWAGIYDTNDIYTLEGEGQHFFKTIVGFPEHLEDSDIIDIYPPEDAVISISQPTFDWKDLEPCDGYQLQISHDSLFQNLLVDTFITEGEFKTRSLSDNEYFWRFRIKREVFYRWTTPVRFFINTSLPTPHEDAFITTPYPNFDWRDEPLTQYYYFQVDDNADFSSPIINTTTVASNFKTTTELDDGIYYWREKANTSNTWSESLKFEVYTAAFGTNCFVPKQENAILDWSPVEVAVKYRVQMAEDAQYSSILLDDSTEASKIVLSESLAKKIRIGGHWWRVRYKDGSNVWSGWIDQYAIRIWDSLHVYPQAFGPGGALTPAWDVSRGAAFIYGLNGYDEPDSNFYKYRISSNTWSYCDKLYKIIEHERVGPGSGASLAWDWGTSSDSGRFIYATLGNETNVFKRYNQWDSSWYDGPDDLPDDIEVSDGGALSFVSSPNCYIFCLVGGDTDLFYRFSWSDEEGGGMAQAKVKISEIFLKPSPNPFKEKASITYSVTKKGIVSLKIYDVKGELVETLERGMKEPGIYDASWNCIDKSGKRVRTGIYFLELQTQNQRLKRKLVLR
jgi:hypothetical protein